MPWKHGVQAYPSLVWKLWNLSLFRTDVVEQESHTRGNRPRLTLSR